MSGTKCILEVMDLCAEKLDDDKTRELLNGARSELNQLVTQKNRYRIMSETTEEMLRREKPGFSVELAKNTPAINIISLKTGDRIKTN